jgi:4-amino-4-deoxy-L-arabinose transferase-like glycosyltransferase
MATILGRVWGRSKKTHPSPPHRLTSSPLLVLGFVAVLFLARLGHRELTSSHEARAAQNAQRMLDTGSWGLPILFDGRTDLQKPPGYYWAVAAVGRLNGGAVDEWAARLPAALAGLLCVGMVFAFLWRDGRPVAGVVAALVLATANHFTAIARTARIDVPLACTVTAALVAFHRGCGMTWRTPTNVREGVEPCAPENSHPLPDGRGSPGTLWHLFAALAAGVAVLLKGPVALALIGPAAAALLVVERPRVRAASWLLIPLVVAAVALPWFVWANATTEGEFFRVFFLHHTVARFTGSSPLLASHPWWYYAPRFALDFLPWTPLLLGAAVWVVRARLWRADSHLRFAGVAFVVMVAVMSAARFKRADYLLPAYPFAAVAVGCVAEAWLRSRREARTVRLAKGLFGGTLAAVVLGWVVMTTVVEPAEEAHEGKRRFAAAIRAYAPPPHTILQFRMESHLLSYHLGRPVHTLVEWGELDDRLAAPGTHFVVMPPEYVFVAGRVVKSRRLVEVTRLDDHTAAKPRRPLVFLRTAD